MTSNSPSLSAAFEALADEAARSALSIGELAVSRLGDSSPFYAAQSSAGELALAIATERDAPQPSVRLESFSAEFGVHYVLQEGQSRERVRVSVLRCHSDRHDIRELFRVVCEAVIRQIGSRATDTSVSEAIGGWLGLFRKLERPPRSTVIGLIGELTFMNSCPDVASAVRAWHHDITDNVDFIFTSPMVEVEVKATAGIRRVHEISLNQVQHEPRVRRYFASILIDRRSSGEPVNALVDQISSKLESSDDVMLLWRGMADTCGDHLGSFLAERFLMPTAASSLELFASNEIPQPQVLLPLHAGVSNIRFRSDFSAANSAESLQVLLA